MAQAATAPNNGAQKTKTAENTTAQPMIAAPAVKVEQPKPEAKKEEVKAPAPPVRTLEQVTREIEQRFQLLQKRDKLIETKAELEFFKLGSTGLRDRLTIGDGTHHQFSTEYSPLVQEVHSVCLSFVEKKLAEIEAEILS